MGRGKANTHTGRSRCQQKSKNQINFNLENKQKRVGKMPKQAKTCTARQYNKAGREKEMGKGEQELEQPFACLAKQKNEEPTPRKGRTRFPPLVLRQTVCLAYAHKSRPGQGSRMPKGGGRRGGGVVLSWPPQCKLGRFAGSLRRQHNLIKWLNASMTIRACKAGNESWG